MRHRQRAHTADRADRVTVVSQPSHEVDHEAMTEAAATGGGLRQQRTVLLVSASDLGWVGLRAILESTPGIAVAGHATHAAEAIDAARILQPDVLLTAPELDGAFVLPLLQTLSAICSACRVIVVAERLSSEQLTALLDAGIAGYLLWDDLEWETLRHALAAVLSGQVMVCSASATEALREAIHHSGPTVTAVPLTVRESAVLTHLAAGRTQREIAEIERVSPRTLARIVTSLMRKLDAESPFMLGVQAVRAGVLA